MEVSKDILAISSLLNDSGNDLDQSLVSLIFEHRLAFKLESSDGQYKKWVSVLEIQNQMIVNELRRCVSVFNKHQISALSFKGPVLSQLLYHKPTIRQFGDLDFLIPQAQISKSIAVLQEIGYKIRSYSSFFKPSFLHKFSNVIVLKHENLGVELELHWQPFPRNFKIANALIGDVFTDAFKVQLQGAELMTMSSEKNLKYLLLHGHKHQWFRLGWLYDFWKLHSLIGGTRCEELLLNTPLKDIYKATVCLAEIIFNNDSKINLNPRANKLFQNYLEVINKKSFPPNIKGKHYNTWRYFPFNKVYYNFLNLWNHFYYPSNADYISSLNSALLYAMIKPFRYLWRFLNK